MTAAPKKDPSINSQKATHVPTATLRNIAVIHGKIDSRDLFVGTREVIISHSDKVYRLRLTSQDKLILTK